MAARAVAQFGLSIAPAEVTYPRAQASAAIIAVRVAIVQLLLAVDVGSLSYAAADPASTAAPRTRTALRRCPLCRIADSAAAGVVRDHL
jgi:hypothetical protein